MYRVVNSYGIKIGHRVYDSDDIDPCRGEISGVPGKGTQWRVHYDPYDVSRIWVCNHHGEGYFMAYWSQLRSMPQPFGDAIWEHARQIEADRGDGRPTEETIKAALDDLLGRASPAPPSRARRRKSAKDRRVVARTKAAAELPPSVPVSADAPESPPLAPPDNLDDVADVIPLPVFDAEKESHSW
jgi:putative transposase